MVIRALTPEQIEILADKYIIGLYQNLEQEVIGDIVRRVKKTERYTETAELMAKSMMENGYSPEKIRAAVLKQMRADKALQDEIAKNTQEYKEFVTSRIKETVKQAKEQGNTLVAEAGNMAYNNDLTLWEQAGQELSRPSSLSQIMNAIRLQTVNELKNLTRSCGFKNMGFESVKNAYQMEMDKALVKVASGTFSFDRAVTDCIQALAQSGLRSIDYESGRSYQLDTAARMSVRTGLNQLAGKIMEANLETTGVKLVITSQHMGSRPEHVPWQNRVFTYSGTPSRRYPDFFKETGYGTVTGLMGANCSHSFYPFWEGISVMEPDIKQPAPVTVGGREYDYYQATQKQRAMERQIRAIRREIEATKAIGGDTAALQSKLRKQTSDYKMFSAEVGIRPKENRLRVVGGSTDLKKTNTQKWIQEHYSGYVGSIPKTWKSVHMETEEILLGCNPKYVPIPRAGYKDDILYNTNCVNAIIAYEMRSRGYNVIAGKASKNIRHDPMLAWENTERIDVKQDAIGEIESQMTAWGINSRACVCISRKKGCRHALMVTYMSDGVKFIDPQTNDYYTYGDISLEKCHEIWFFRTDNAIISQRGTNACERE